MSTLLNIYSDKQGDVSEMNFGVEYVIQYKVPVKERAAAEAGFVKLVEALTKVGLATEVRPGDRTSLLIFVKMASEELLRAQVYRSRLHDWLYGVRTVAPDSDISTSFKEDPVTEAERLRIVYLLITRPNNDGGAGVVPGQDPWALVKSIFPLHDHAFNRQWLKNWSSKYLLTQADLDEMRNRFGENVAFYFAFTQSYFLFLIIPTIVGALVWLMDGANSFTLAIANGLWSVIFIEYWKKKEVDLAVQWGVRNVSNIQHQRPQFQYEYEAEDPVTGEKVKVYPPYRRLLTQLLQIPFALMCILVLGAIIATGTSLEIFITEVYDGPLKQWLAFLPTILLIILTPTASKVLLGFGEQLTDMENYENVDEYQAALVQKQFVLNFMTSYMPLLFAAFVYAPFSHLLEPLLEFWRATAQLISKRHLTTSKFTPTAGRLGSLMFFATVPDQFINFLQEIVVPYAKLKFFATVKDVQNSRPQIKDAEEEAPFLNRVRAEMELEDYDVTEDYREMVMQYGYITLFGVAFPLGALADLINNWVELRSDALKIATAVKRPIPWRADSIGPWLTALGFLSWLGSLTSSSVVYLSRRNTDPESAVHGWGLLLSILLSEHIYLCAQVMVGFVFSKIESPGLENERRERYNMKRRLLQEHLGQDVVVHVSTPHVEYHDKMTQDLLEAEARLAAMSGERKLEEAFWHNQRAMRETIEAGRDYIQQLSIQALRHRSTFLGKSKGL